MTKNLVRTTILIDKELWKRFRIKAMKEDVPASGLLEKLIKKEVDS